MWPVRGTDRGMDPMATKHNHQLVFGRREAGCPRCAELDQGAQPVRWKCDSVSANEARRMREVKAHDCKARGCGPICTFGDW